MGPPTPTPTPTPTRPTAKPSHASTGDDKDPLRKGLDEVFPPLRDLPSWSLPIVDNVQQHAVKGTVVQARVDEHGTLYVCGTVKADDALLHHQGHGRHRPKPGKHAAASTGVEVMLRVEDPTTATPANPATVTVTALARHASTPVVTTTQITDPTTATDDAVRAVDDAVTDAAAVAPDPMPDPTPTDGEQIFTGLTLGGQMALGPDGGVIQLGPPEPLDDVDQVEPTDPPTTP
jgi:hypothetical protein